MTRSIRIWLACALTVPLVLIAAGIAAQQGEEGADPQAALVAFRTAVSAELTPIERRRMQKAWPSKVMFSGADRAHKNGAVPRGEVTADKDGPAPRGGVTAEKNGGVRNIKIETASAVGAQQFDLADQAVHGFLVQALSAARLDALAQQVRALPAVQGAPAARGARVRLQRLLRVADRRAQPAIDAAIAALGASLGADAAGATARSLARVVSATLAVGAPRDAVLSRVEAIGRGELPAGG